MMRPAPSYRGNVRLVTLEVNTDAVELIEMVHKSNYVALVFSKNKK